MTTTGKKYHKSDKSRTLKSENFPILPVCNCKAQCSVIVPDEFRKLNHKAYWDSGSAKERSNFITTHVQKIEKARHRSGDITKRENTFVYHLTATGGAQKKVCRTFFLHTLGYKSSNNKVISQTLKKMNNFSLKASPALRGRKRETPTMQKQREAVLAHIETYHPTASHYRREHAPNRRYLPNELNITSLYQDFIAKHEEYKMLRYETYRKLFKTTNISICKLGHEECEECETMNNHHPEHSKDQLGENCEECMKWSQHIERAKSARDLYQLHAEIASATEDVIFYSIDMEKVIMLPRLDTYKQALFTRRISTYNETFAPIGSFNKPNKPVIAVLWHEGVASRKQEQVISAYNQFFVQMRDSKHIVLWLDNCSNQNKNWCLLTFLVEKVNSSDNSIETIDLYFFEPGHTYMSADSFHQKVEKSLKSTKNVYDFTDFSTCVEKALPNVKVIPMTSDLFQKWRSYKSSAKLKKLPKTFYLRDVKQLRATRGDLTIKYKTAYETDDEDMLTLDFLMKSIKKEGFPVAETQADNIGVLKEKKDDIIQKLCPLMPPSRRQFWQDLSEEISADSSNKSKKEGVSGRKGNRHSRKHVEEKNDYDERKKKN